MGTCVCGWVHVYGCMCMCGVHVYVCGCGCMCMCVDACMCGWVHVFVCGCTYVWVGACVWVHVYQCGCMYVWVGACVWVHVYVCGYPGKIVVKRDVFCCDNLYYGLLLLKKNCYPVCLFIIINLNAFDVALDVLFKCCF